MTGQMANVLQLEAKSLQSLLNKKPYQSDAVEHRAQKLLRDVMMLRDSLVARNARKDAAADAAVDGAPNKDPGQPSQADLVDDTSAVRRSPMASMEAIDPRSVAPVLAGTGRNIGPSTSHDPYRDASEGHHRPVVLQRGIPVTSRMYRHTTAPTTSPKSSSNTNRGRASPTSSNRGISTQSKRPSLVTSAAKIETVPERRAEALSSNPRMTPPSTRRRESPTSLATSKTAHQQPPSHHGTLTPSMIREREEVDKVIDLLLRSAEVDAVEAAPVQPVLTDALVASVLASETRSAVDSDNFYSSLRRNARKYPNKFLVRICCSLLLLGLAAFFVAFTVMYGSRVLARASKLKKHQAQNYDNNSHDEFPHIFGGHRSGNDDDGSHVSVQDLSGLDVHESTNETAEAPSNDVILDIS
ncbi:uncharacterized protein LOC142768861 isoform X3 [Rhipicephalus microplus]|uniref:uncharacterized protein LOC142768861 isoform X3 n=1 Tax=Rhipicephalus microplus TaxID=6941 RepID=UPI003F6B92D3